jgi:hypothetical protein
MGCYIKFSVLIPFIALIINFLKIGKYKLSAQGFTDAEEVNLEDYFKWTSNIYYGFSVREVRKFAFQYTVVSNKKSLKARGIGK